VPPLPAFDGAAKPCDTDAARVDAYMIPPACPAGVQECRNSTNHCASLSRLPGGGVGLAWFSGYREGWDLTQAVFARLPAGASQWLPPVSISQEPGFSLQNAVLYVDDAGSLFAFHVRQPKGNEEAGDDPVPSQERYGKVWLSKSGDEGATWAAAELFEPEEGTWTRHGVTEGLDGSLMLPLYNESQKYLGHAYERPVLLRRGPGPLQPYAEWTKVEMAVNGSYLVQPAIVRLTPGEPQLRAFFRDRRAEWIYTSVSEDDGLTWSEARQTELPNNNVGIDAIRVGSGAIVVSYNNMRGQTKHNRRNRLAIAISDDGGETFPIVRQLEQHPDPTEMEGPEEGLQGVGPTSCDCYSYPSLLEGDNGKIHVAFTYERRTIKVTSVTENWIRDASGPLCQFGPTSLLV